MQPISLAITSYNRFEPLMRSFEQVVNDPRIYDIVINDDDSDSEIYEAIKSAVANMPKVKLTRNFVNVNMAENKLIAVTRVNKEFAILFDSDNILSKKYIDALEAVGKFEEDTLYLPVKALPNFDFSSFSGHTITRHNVRSYMDDPQFRVAMNCCNCLVNRDRYIETCEVEPGIEAADTIRHIYAHLSNDGKLYFVPGMEYIHNISHDSGFLKDVNGNMRRTALIEDKIRNL